MKRSVTIVLIIVILINTIFPNFIYASDYGSYEEAQEHQQEGGTINNKLWEFFRILWIILRFIWQGICYNHCMWQVPCFFISR